MGSKKIISLVASVCLLIFSSFSSSERLSAFAQEITSAASTGAAAKPVKMLTGRLEEVGGNGASLPVGVMLKLKSQVARVDPGAAPVQLRSQAQRLEGQVESFPMDWQGAWSGQLKVHARQAAPIAYAFDDDETRMEDKIFTPGTMGSVVFDFNQRGRDIMLEPARITFPPRTDTAGARAAAQQLRALGLDRMMGGNSQMLSMMTAGVPVFYLGNTEGVRGVTGNILSAQVVKNDIRQLKPGVLEQNIVVREQDTSARSGQVGHSISETVLRFTKLNASQLYVQAASIKYRKDGLFETKVLMYGTVNRGQATASPMPGAFPGMPASGYGGTTDLNNLLKNLQGF